MKRYTVSGARNALAEVLDNAEQGETVVIERRGVRFAVSTITKPVRASRTRSSRVAYMDASIEEGSWTWDWSPGGIELASRPPGARKKARQA